MNFKEKMELYETLLAIIKTLGRLQLFVARVSQDNDPEHTSRIFKDVSSEIEDTYAHMEKLLEQIKANHEQH